MRLLGVLGGMSWTSTETYYRLLNAGVAERLGGLHSARLVLHLTEDARKTISAARFIPAIRDRISRYLSQDFPEQLALASRYAATLKAPPAGKPDGQVAEPAAKEPSVTGRLQRH